MMILMFFFYISIDKAFFDVKKACSQIMRDGKILRDGKRSPIYVTWLSSSSIVQIYFTFNDKWYK